MGRPRRYETPAEKQKAYRERQDEGVAPLQPLQEALGARDEAEEAYVQEQLAQTRAYAESFRAPEKSSPEAIEERLKRAEAYARWRWREYQLGNVFSL